MVCQFLFFIFQWLVCITYLLPNLACGLAMTFSVTGLPHYQSAAAGSGNGDPESTSSSETEMVSTPPASGIVLDEDQGSWFGMGFLISTMLQWYHRKWIWWFHRKKEIALQLQLLLLQGIPSGQDWGQLGTKDQINPFEPERVRPGIGSQIDPSF